MLPCSMLATLILFLIVTAAYWRRTSIKLSADSRFSLTGYTRVTQRFSHKFIISLTLNNMRSNAYGHSKVSSTPHSTRSPPISSFPAFAHFPSLFRWLFMLLSLSIFHFFTQCALHVDIESTKQQQKTCIYSGTLQLFTCFSTKGTCATENRSRFFAFLISLLSRKINTIIATRRTRNTSQY